MTSAMLSDVLFEMQDVMFWLCKKPSVIPWITFPFLVFSLLIFLGMWFTI